MNDVPYLLYPYKVLTATEQQGEAGIAVGVECRFAFGYWQPTKETALTDPVCGDGGAPIGGVDPLRPSVSRFIHSHRHLRYTNELRAACLHPCPA
jgi:hypothetical protein